MTVFHELTMTSLAGDPVDFARFDSKICLIVNVASA